MRAFMYSLIVILTLFLGIPSGKANDFSTFPATVEPVERKSWKYELSLGVGVGFEWSPYTRYDTQWSVVPIVDFDSEYVYLQNMRAGVKFLTLGDVALSAFVGYDSTSFDTDNTDDRRMKRLKSRHESAVVGGRATWLSPIGLFDLSLAGDVSGHSNGFTGSLGYFYSLELGRVEFVPQVGVNWASKKYNDYYYGVSGDESRKSGLKEYTAKSAFTPYTGLTINVTLDEAEHWDVFCNGQVEWLPGTIKDSPMVDRSQNYKLTTGLSYTF